MRYVLVLVITLSLLGVEGSPVWADADFKMRYDKIFNTPDYTQNSRKDLPGKGWRYCAPAAVSNSLIWLSDNGYPNLTPEGIYDPEVKQYELIKEISSERFMNINLDEVTWPSQIMRAIYKYIRHKGYFGDLRYQGWRTHHKKFSTGIKKPQIEWLKSSIKGKGAVWLNVGWYQYNPLKAEYTRIGGHWVTLVGYIDNESAPGGVQFIIHDPAPRAGKTFSNETINLNPIPTGMLVGTLQNMPLDATGYFKIQGGMHIKEEADFGILDGAIALRMDDVRYWPGTKNLQLRKHYEDGEHVFTRRYYPSGKKQATMYPSGAIYSFYEDTGYRKSFTTKKGYYYEYFNENHDGDGVGRISKKITPSGKMIVYPPPTLDI